MNGKCLNNNTVDGVATGDTVKEKLLTKSVTKSEITDTQSKGQNQLMLPSSIHKT